jgi:hypothetical protein
MNIDQIKAAIEYPSKVGNVSVTFPNYGVYNDNITTACSSHVNRTVCKWCTYIHASVSNPLWELYLNCIISYIHTFIYTYTYVSLYVQSHSFWLFNHVWSQNGGFLVLFNTEFGNLGLLTAVPNTNIIITEFQKGKPFIFPF